MSIPFRTDHHVTMFLQRQDEDQPRQINTTVRGFNDDHCWLEHLEAAGLMFDRMTGGLCPKIKGAYCAIHTTNESGDR